MYGTTQVRHQPRFQPPSSTESPNIEDVLIADTGLHEKCEACVDPITISGEPTPTTYIYVGSDGTVKQKIVRPTSQIFSRFMPPTEPLTGTIKEETKDFIEEIPKPSRDGNIFEMLSKETLPGDEIDRIVQERVEKVLRERLQSSSTETVSQSTQESVFIPFFNDELYATTDSKTTLNGNILTINAELAGMLSEEPTLYIFGSSSLPIGNRINVQRMDFKWFNDTQKGLIRGHLNRNETTGNYIAKFERIVAETGKEDPAYEEIKFDDICLPATFTFSGPLTSPM